ncbi:uncharacterized protein [Parasteatoda tepidariorum]|uniref:uncharacterized protein n=1 Tax=Parasteatoda tepidariorum TaxID=114398 RepID=UPI0039BCA679
MNDYTVSTTDSQKNNLDLKIAKFFYANNIAFNAATTIEFKEMVTAMRPGYSGPTRTDLGGKLLDEVHENIEDEIKKEMQSVATVTLLLDGWSNINRDAVLATCVHTGNSSFLLNAVDCESNKKTSEYCAELAEKDIEHCEKNLDVKVFAICTDNENKMVKLRQLIKEKHKGIVTYGCSAHYINLLADEITNKDVIKHVAEVQKFFRNTHQPHGLLKEKGGLMPQLPNATRWNSQIHCIDTYIKNYHKFVEISTEAVVEIPTNIIRILDNVAIYKEALHMQKQLSELSEVLNLMQAEKTNISTAVELWLDVFNSENLCAYKKQIDKRLNQALLPIHYLANIMDPKYAGKRLTSDMLQKAEEWLETEHPKWLIPLMSYKLKDPEIFPPSMFNADVIKKFSASQWWKLVEMRTNDRDMTDFCNFMVALSNCPASSASLERVFSTCGLVWSKLRNRLGVQKALKLVKIHRHLRLKNSNTDNLIYL